MVNCIRHVHIKQMKKNESKHKIKGNLSFILWKKVPGVQDIPGRQIHKMLASTTASDPTLWPVSQ